MRILHTSDWHLGRTFGSVSLTTFHEQFVDWVVEVCATESIDLVVIAGDVFDRAIAPADAVALFRDALRRLRGTGALVAVISGNHDGPERVAPYDEMLDTSGVIIRGGYRAIGEVITVPVADGPLDLVMLPFLDPQSAPDSLPHDVASDDAPDVTPDDDAVARLLRRTHASVLKTAIRATTPRLISPRSLAVAHAFVDGGESSDSERQLTVGGTGSVPADIFAGFSYTALGHLHRPQAVAGIPTLRYSGTPLAYSFSENHAKSVTIVDMAADGSCAVHDIAVPVGRRVHEVTGTIDDLLTRSYGADITECFVKAIVTDDALVIEPKQRLLTVLPNLVDVIVRPPERSDGSGAGPSGDIVRLTPTQAVAQFWSAARGTDPTDDVTALFHEALVAVSGEGDH